jgi:hypothetical protein
LITWGCLSPRGAIILIVGGSGIREAIRSFVTEEQWNQFASAAFPGRRSNRTARSDEPYREALTRASLGIEVRDARFTVSWAGIVNGSICDGAYSWTRAARHRDPHHR